MRTFRNLIPFVVFALMLVAPAPAVAKVSVGIDVLAHTANKVHTGDVVSAAYVLYNDGTSGAATEIRLEGRLLEPLGVRVVDASDAARANVDIACTDTGFRRATCSRYLPPGYGELIIVVWGAGKAGRGYNSLSVVTPGDSSLGDNSAGKRVVTTHGRDCTVEGGAGGLAGAGSRETIEGTAGNDVLCGFGGQSTCGLTASGYRCTAYHRDVVRGKGGNDVILAVAVGGPGLDGPGDTLDGGAGRDMLVNADRYCTTASVFFNGGSLHYECGRTTNATLHDISNFEVYGGAHYGERITGSGDAESLRGNGGPDSIVGNGGDDTLNGGRGKDLLHFGNNLPGRVVVDVAARTAQDGRGGTDRIFGFERYRGTGRADTFLGSDRREIFIASLGDDQYDGRGGRDAVVYRDFDRRYDIFANLETDKVAVDTRDNEQVITSIETLVGTKGHDVMIGSSGVDVLNGMGGTDWLRGAGGNDILLGGDDRDRLEGGGGVDKLFGQGGDNVCRQYPASAPYAC